MAASTASPFFHSVREAFLAGPVPTRPFDASYHLLAQQQAPATAAAIRQRLAATLQQGQPSNGGLTGGGASLLRNASPPNRRADSVDRSDANSGDGDEVLSEAEMAVLRVVELAEPMRVLVDVASLSQRQQQQAPAPSDGHDATLAEICAAATMKIYPRHVVFTKENGAALTDFAIADLIEINEIDELHALDFVLRRTTAVAEGAGGSLPQTQTVRIVTPSTPARGAVYKLVCGKRSAMGTQAH